MKLSLDIVQLVSCILHIAKWMIAIPRGNYCMLHEFEVQTFVLDIFAYITTVIYTSYTVDMTIAS